MTTFWFLRNIKHHNHATFMNQKVVSQNFIIERSALPNLYYLGGEGLASFAGLDRVDPDELDEDERSGYF